MIGFRERLKYLLDQWHGTLPFSFQIPDLFVLAVLLWLRKLWWLTTFSSGNGRSWNPTFHRSFQHWELEYDDTFLGDLYTINFNYQNDVLQWERHDSCIL